MARPGFQVTVRDTPPARGAPTDTSRWFVVGQTERGPITPVLCRSMQEFEDAFDATSQGSRTYGVLSDAVETYFREGGSSIYVSRVVGTVPVKATHTFLDAAGTPAATMRVDAIDYGEWGNSLRVQVVAGGTGGTFILVVSHSTLGELERSPELADVAAAEDWSETSDFIRVVDIGTSALDPAVIAATPLTGGDDDDDTVVDSHWTTALASFSADLGPGQVSMPGRTTATAYSTLTAHAAANNRVAYLDAPDSASLTTLNASLVSARGDGSYGGMFWPWAVIPGVTVGTTRVVPWSAVAAAHSSRNDAALNQNVPAAGANGIARYVVGLSQDPMADADREDENALGLNVAIEQFGQIMTYGWRTLDIADANWVSLGYSRLRMAIVAASQNVASAFVFAEIDGRNIAIGAFNGLLTRVLDGFYSAGALFGATAQDAYIVDTGPSVNTPTRLENLELHAAMAVRMSPFAELVVIEISKTRITEVVA